MSDDELTTLLPDSSTAFERSHSAIDQRLLAADTDIIRRQREAATCTATFLPFLAWERSVHHWTGTDEALDRARVASSFADHAGYGAPSALEDELRIELAFAAIAIREWWEVPGFAWPDFQVVVGVVADGPTLPSFDSVFAAAVRRKNVRDWPLVLYEARETGPCAIASAAVLNATIHSLPLDPTPHSLGDAYYGARGTLFATINSRPL